MATRPRTFVDRGGTFTDIIRILPDGLVEIDKVPSDRAVVGDLAVGALTFGTTVATNALLEGNKARTLLVVGRGFRDLPIIGDQTRPSLFDSDRAWPLPLCSAVEEVDGRIDSTGRELAAVDTDGLDVTGFESVAITPVLMRALDQDRIGEGDLAIRSDGSLVPARDLRAPDAVLSGPAGGVLAVARIAEQAGLSQAVGLDMGGTSTDVCRVDVGQLPRREGDGHRARFGFGPGQTIEVVNARVRACEPRPEPATVDDDPWGIGDATIDGPRLLPMTGTAVWLPAGWTARRQNGLLELHRSAPPPRHNPAVRTPYAVELWSNRFQAVAEEAGEVLRRLARSVNIRHRLDFSCAIFDGAGRLVANAPHIPVHLAAMGETVRDLLEHHPDPEPGQAYLSNDPFAGGSHLPDLTVVSSVYSGDRRWFVANRGHHVDVGGLTPGSMPPHSTRLADEGFVVRQLPLMDPTGRESPGGGGYGAVPDEEC